MNVKAAIVEKMTAAQDNRDLFREEYGEHNYYDGMAEAYADCTLMLAKQPTRFENVREFHRAYGQPVANKPRLLDRGHDALDENALLIATNRLELAMIYMKDSPFGGRLMKRASWILEELIELMRAETLVDQMDACADLEYLVNGCYVEAGVVPDQIFDDVHEANMDKLEDGKPVLNEQGKVTKRKGWVGPEMNIAAEIARQADGVAV